MQSSRFQVKIRTPDTIRRYSFSSPPSWSSFVEHLTLHIFCVPPCFPSAHIKISYYDDENDLVTIESEEEWQEMIRQKKTCPLISLFMNDLPKQFNFTPELSNHHSDNHVDLNRSEPVKTDIPEINNHPEPVKTDIPEINNRPEDLSTSTDPEKLNLPEILNSPEENHPPTEELHPIETDLLSPTKEDEKQEELKYTEALRQKLEALKIQEEKLFLFQQKQESPLRNMWTSKLQAFRNRKEQYRNRRKEEELKKREEEKQVSHSFQNTYLQKYNRELHHLYEAGFTDLQRNLYLLITFNGDLNHVIDSLAQINL
jgi:hypothetical protein